MQLLALAIAPGLAICIFIYFKDKYNKEPLLVLALSFLFGMFSIIPAIISELFFGHQLRSLSLDNVSETAISAYAVIALSEELSKFLVLRWYCYTRRSFDEPFDGIVYAVMVGMGFATLENISYVLQNGFANGVMRMLLSVPAHGTFAILMGYFVSLAKFKPEKKYFYFFLSILLPVIFHGTYDFFLFVGTSLMHFAGALVAFFVAIWLSVIAIKRKQLYSKTYLEALEKKHDAEETVL